MGGLEVSVLGSGAGYLWIKTCSKKESGFKNLGNVNLRRHVWG